LSQGVSTATLVQTIKNASIGSARNKRWFIEYDIVPVLVGFLVDNEAIATSNTKITNANTTTTATTTTTKSDGMEVSNDVEELMVQSAACIGSLASGGDFEVRIS
jgi:hypothetical protein